MSGFMDILESILGSKKEDSSGKPPTDAPKVPLTQGQKLQNGLAAFGNTLQDKQGAPLPQQPQAVKPAAVAGAPAAPTPGAAPTQDYKPPPGWTIAPVRADAPNTYMPPAGWAPPGQAIPPPQAPLGYQPPPGWQVPGQTPGQQVVAGNDAAQQAALQAALAQRFGQ